MQKYKNLRKTVALLMSVLIIVGSCITAFAATDNFTQKSNTKVYLDSTGATIDQLIMSKATKITLITDSSYSLMSGTGSSTVNFTNQIDGSSGTLFHNGGAMTIDKAKYPDGTTKYVWCIRPSAKYGSYSDLDVSTSLEDATDYYKALNRNSNADLKKAIGKTIAYGTYLISHSSSNNDKAKYYFATQLILWEFISGQRNTNYSHYSWKEKDKYTNNYAYKKGAYNFLNYISGSHKSDVSDGISDIIYAMRRTTQIPNGFYKTLDNAVSHKDTNRIAMEDPNQQNKNFTKSKTFTGITKIEEKNELNFSVVNQNNESGATAKSVKVSVSGNKVTVSTTEDLSSKSNTYYLKVTKSKDYTEAKNDIVFDDTNSQAMQTLANKIQYEEDVVGYYPITTIHESPEPTTQPTTPAPTGSLQIKKTIQTNCFTNIDEDSYTGWVFSVEAKDTSGKTIGTYRVFTDENGLTPAIKDLPIGTVCTIKELGKNITDLLEGKTKEELIDEGYKNITEIDTNLVCSFPPNFYVNNNVETKTITVANQVTSLSYNNQCYFPVKLNINKSCTDNDSPEGYYFIIYSEGVGNTITFRPQIVGPTDKEGNIKCLINRPYSGEAFGCIELGKAIDPEKLADDWDTISDLGNSFDFVETYETRIKALLKQYFCIPDKYKQPKNGARQIYEAFPLSFTNKDIELGSKDFYISNEAFGKIKIVKTDDVYNKPMAGITFELYAPKNANSFAEYLEDEEKGLNPELPETSELDTLIETLTTNNEGEVITKTLPVGVYYLKETSGCPKYAEPIKDVIVVNLTSDTNTEEQPNIVEVPIINKLSKLTVNKLGVTSADENGTPLAGAIMQIFETPTIGDIDYNTAIPLKEFTTTTSSFELNGVLEIGKSYTLHEKAAPAGYIKSQDIVFTLENGNEKVINVKDISTKVKVVKIDKKTSKNMANVRMQIQDEQGNPVKVKDYMGNSVESWLTQTNPLLIEGILESGKKYQLVELETLPGYTLAKPVPFEVSTEGNFQSVTMYNDTTKVSFSKTTLTGSEELEGCKLQVADKDGNVIDSWISGKEAHLIEGKLIVGETYTMTETEPADGYATAESITFTVADNDEVETVTMKDDTTKVSFSKTTLTGSEELEGCNLQVTDKDGNVIDSWTSGKEAHLIEGRLIVGETYTMTETKPADGYATAESITFTVSDTGEVQNVTMKDDTTKVSFSKTTLTGSEELEGCNLQVTDKDGNVIDSWTSGKEAHLIEGKLIVGETYTMTETKPADGYATAESITFTVADNDEVQTVTMKDDTTKVSFSKTTLTGSEELEGCKLQVADKDGNVIDSWISGKEAHLIEGKLIVGETYTMTETKPADGYATAESITFTVSDTGEVQTVTMKDDTIKVSITKYDITGDKELENAKISILDKNNSVVESWISTTKAHLVEGKLAAGEVYTLHEEISPDGYVLANDVKFTVLDTGSIQSFEMKDDTTKVEIVKLAGDTNKNLKNAKLQLKDTKGNIIDTWTTTDESHYIEGTLVAGKTYILSEISAPKGYKKAEDVKFTVKTDGTKQIVTMVDEKLSIEDPLPKTGGSSTSALFLALGLTMMIAGFLIFCRVKTTKR